MLGHLTIYAFFLKVQIAKVAEVFKHVLRIYGYEKIKNSPEANIIILKRQ